MKKLVLILGSGFSKAAGLPTTSDLNSYFLNPERVPNARQGVKPQPEDTFISRVLEKYWADVFGWREGNPHPSLEEHFTQLDYAANSGHHLGEVYSPKHLRAIRRFSIHRIFQLLDAPDSRDLVLGQILTMAFQHFDTSIVTLNWDVVIESLLLRGGGACFNEHLRIRPSYEVDEVLFDVDQNAEMTGPILDRPTFPMLRIHGAANWMYCDNCRHIFADLSSKSALRYRAYLEKDDFGLDGFSSIRDIQIDYEQMIATVVAKKRDCSRCECGLAGRLATFSYRKAFSIYQFQVTWKRAFEELRDADAWLIFGYSLPEADYEFKSLLKAAQLARRSTAGLHIEVTTGPLVEQDQEGRQSCNRFNMETRNRYDQFFGSCLTKPCSKYLAEWVVEDMSDFIREMGVS